MVVVNNAPFGNKAPLPPAGAAEKMGAPARHAPPGAALPCFPGGAAAGENAARRSFPYDVPKMAKANRIEATPRWWLEGGDGWATVYFTDLESFDLEARHPGVHRCLLPRKEDDLQCRFVVSGGERTLCKSWTPLGRAPALMAAHLEKAHGIQPPPTRTWGIGDGGSSEFFLGLCDAVCCWGCQLSRQQAALNGYRATDPSRGHVTNCLCCCCAAYSLRRAIVALHRIEETACRSCLCSFLCTPCSVAKTYREFSAAGLWPGSICDKEEPQLVRGVIIVPPPSSSSGGGSSSSKA